jgi:hypothetical protein
VAVSWDVFFLRRGNSQRIELGFRREKEREITTVCNDQTAIVK